MPGLEGACRFVKEIKALLTGMASSYFSREVATAAFMDNKSIGGAERKYSVSTQATLSRPREMWPQMSSSTFAGKEVGRAVHCTL